MFNFLPQKNKNQIVIEYFLRLAIFLLYFVLATSLILISLFTPTFFFNEYKNAAVNSQLKSIKQQNINSSEDPANFIKNTNRLAVALANGTNATITHSDLINKVVSLKNKGIKILSISISTDNANNETISVNGISSTRDSLTTYEKNIQTDGFFDKVTFPVLDFIKSSNSNFSVTLTYKNK